MKHCAEALAKEPDLADTYLLYSLQQVMLALRAAESDPAGTGTRQVAAEAMQVGATLPHLNDNEPNTASPNVPLPVLLPCLPFRVRRSVLPPHQACAGHCHGTWQLHIAHVNDFGVTPTHAVITVNQKGTVAWSALDGRGKVTLNAQELVRQLYRRPKITLALLEPQASRTGPASLQEVMHWLWPLTAAPQRAFRANAMWLHKHLAALLQSGSGAGKLPCQPFHARP